MEVIVDVLISNKEPVVLVEDASSHFCYFSDSIKQSRQDVYQLNF